MVLVSENFIPSSSNKLSSSSNKLSSSSSRFCNSSISKRIFSDGAGEITVYVDGQSFQLPKIPFISHSLKIRKMVVDSSDTEHPQLELFDVPGGPETFKLAAEFYRGTKFEITTANVAHLRCIAEYLEMTDKYKEENLVATTETYLNNVVTKSLEKSLEVLFACQGLLPLAEDLGIINRCIDAIAENATNEQSWVENLSILKIDFYRRVIDAMTGTGVRSESINLSLIHYGHSSLKGFQCINFGEEYRSIVETLVCLMATEKNIMSLPLSFLFGMLRMAIETYASFGCKVELEKRIGFQLEMASLNDLLVPSLKSKESVFDINTVYRILESFLKRIEDEGSVFKSSNHSSIMTVGRLVDGYLAEIATYPQLKLKRFIQLIELVPECARKIEDGLYRAVDIYLEAHPLLSKSDCKRLCKLINCQRLSQEASNHAAQNDRLPIQMAVRVLYFEQLRIMSDFYEASDEVSFFRQMTCNNSAVSSAGRSPKDNYAILRTEYRELKLEISRMRVRVSELERERHQCMRNETTLFSSLSRSISCIWMFSTDGANRHKSTRKPQGQDGEGRHRRLRHLYCKQA